MPIKTINTIQNPESYKVFIEKYFEDTLEDTLQALANSGNRIGVAGSSIQYHSYNIFDIIDDMHIDSKNKSNYAIKFEYLNSQYKYQVYDLETNFPVLGSTEKYISETNTIDLNDNETKQENKNSLYSSIKNKILMFFGHIDDISKNSIIHKKNDILTCIFKCHIINTEPDDEGSAEYLYFQYNIQTNTLINFLDIKQHDEKYYVVYKLEYNEENNYKFDIHLFKLAPYNLYDKENNSLEDYIKSFIGNSYIDFDLKKLFIYENKDEINDSFSFLKSDFADFDKLCNIEYVYNSSSIIQFILNYDETLEYDIIHSVEEIITNNNESMYFFINDDSLLIKQLINRLSRDDINEYLWIASSIHELYKYILDIYNSNFYISSKKQLFINIIKTLYSYIYNEYNDNSNKSALYIPYNVKLNYLSSDTNELKLMYLNNIDIIHWNGTDIELSKDHITYYDANIENKITNYNIYIDYNDEFQDVINDIIIYKTYTYPYINKLNDWIINDVNSGISSYNELLSLNKLIILYCDKFNIEDSTNYSSKILKLNNISDQDKMYFGEYSCETFIVNSEYFPSYRNSTIKCNTLVPKVTDVNKNYFENALLLIVTNKDNLVNQNYTINYTGNYIYSLWKYTNEDEDKFSAIIDPTALNDENNEIKYVFDPFGYNLINSIYSNNILYLNANNNKTGQSTDNLSIYDYVVLRNKLAYEYNKNEYISNYENNLNIIIECVNNLNKTGENPNYPEEKFIKDTSSIITSNELYPKYKFKETKDYEITKYNQVQKDITELLNDEHVQLYIYKDEQNNDYLISQEYIKQIERAKSITVYEPYKDTITQITTSISDSEKYEEFVPDKKDIPSIDYKEILQRNINILNRINILGVVDNSQVMVNSEKRWYNGFFGTYFDEEDKSILGISTNSTNINVGTDTLFDLEQVKRFNIFDKFKIDGFNTIELDPKKNIIVNKPIVNKEIILNDYIVKSISCIPIGNIYKNDIDSININITKESENSYKIQNISNLITFDDYDNFDQSFVNDVVNKNIFIQGGTYVYSTNQTENQHLKSFKLLYLNNLIADKFGLDISIVNKLNASNIKCPDNLLLCISTKRIINSGSSENYKNYFFMIIMNENELDNLINDIYIYNHQLNMTMITYNNSYNFNIKFDDTKLNEYDYSVLLGSISNQNIQYGIEYYINEYNNLSDSI